MAALLKTNASRGATACQRPLHVLGNDIILVPAPSDLLLVANCDAHRSNFDKLELAFGTDDEGIATRRAGHSTALPGNTATTAHATVSNGSVRPRGLSHINNLKDAQYLDFAFGP